MMTECTREDKGTSTELARENKGTSMELAREDKSITTENKYYCFLKTYMR